MQIKRHFSMVFISILLFAIAVPWASASEIKIAVKHFPPFVFKEELQGFCIDMANIICKKHNLRPAYIRYHSVPELLAAVETGECDIGFSGITITADREKRVDFSQPFFDSGLMIAVRSETVSHAAFIFKVVLKVVGLSFVVFLIGLTLVAHCIWFFEKDDSDAKSFSSSYRRGILDAYWWAVVTMTTVGYGDKTPKKNTGRLVAALWMMISIIWFAGFTATLSSALTVDRIQHGAIKGLADLDNKRVAVIQGTTSEAFMRYYNVKLHLTNSLEELITRLKNKEVEAVVYDAPALLYTAKNDRAIKVAGELFDEQQYGVVFPEDRHEEYKELFNIAILEMKRSGEYDRLYTKWF